MDVRDNKVGAQFYPGTSAMLVAMKFVGEIGYTHLLIR